MPIADKLVLPQGYGQTTESLAWEDVRTQLEQAKQYWLATNRGDGSPHVVPVDGLWVDDVWYYGGSPENRPRAAGAGESVRDHAPAGPVEGRGGAGRGSRVETFGGTGPAARRSREQQVRRVRHQV